MRWRQREGEQGADKRNKEDDKAASRWEQQKSRVTIGRVECKSEGRSVREKWRIRRRRRKSRQRTCKSRKKKKIDTKAQNKNEYDT